MRNSLLLVCWLLAPLSAHAQSESFVVTVGKDTVAVENFTLSSTRLEGELVTRGAGARLKYSGDVVNGRIRVLHSAAFTGADTSAAQTAVLRFVNDSVIVDVTTGGTTTTQRIASRPGAQPLINLAFSFVEIALRGVRSDSASIPFFLVTGGQTLMAQLRRHGADALVLSMAGVDLELKTAEGRITGGAVPAQNVIIHRGARGRVPLKEKKPDYTAPPGRAIRRRTLP